ncbi:MAG: hypothetical protein WCQ64_07925, partial [Acidobacteriota bacterium]
MTSRTLVAVVLAVGLTMSAPLVARQTPKAPAAPAAPKTALIERIGDTAFIQLEAESFNALTPKQQALAYWLAQASIAIDPIIYDQLSTYGLREPVGEGLLLRRQR